MADQEYKVRISLDGAQQAASGAQKVDASLAGMGKAALAAGAAMFTAQGVVAGIRALGDLADRAARVDKVAAAFEGLTAKAKFTGDTLARLQSATRGAVTDFELMRQTNNALLLGVGKSSDQMAEMAEISRRLGNAMGIDTAQALESLVIGLGRQSKLYLDNLGIIVDVEKAYKKYADTVNKSVDELNDYERKLAFTNETMISARDLVSGLGDDLVTHADKVMKAKAEWENFKDEVGSGFQSAAMEGAGFLRMLSLIAYSPFSSVARKEIVDTLQRMKDEEVAAAAQTQDFTKAITDQDVAIYALNQKLKANVSVTVDSAAAQEAALKAMEGRFQAQEIMAESALAVNTLLSELGIARLEEERAQAEEFRAIRLELDDWIIEEGDRLFAADAVGVEKRKGEIKKEIEARKMLKDATAQGARDMIGSIAGLNQAYRGSAILTKRLLQAEAVANTFAAATDALKFGAKLGPGVAFPYAALIVAKGLANVAMIESQSYREGGVIEGAGGPRQDNQQINVSRGESILNAEVTAQYGRDGIDRLNRGQGLGVTLNFNGPFIGTEAFVRDNLMPQIEASLKRRLA